MLNFRSYVKFCRWVRGATAPLPLEPSRVYAIAASFRIAFHLKLPRLRRGSLPAIARVRSMVRGQRALRS